MLQTITEGDHPAGAFHFRLKLAINQTMSQLVLNYNPAAHRHDVVHEPQDRQKIASSCRAVGELQHSLQEDFAISGSVNGAAAHFE